jgi:peptide-methionine (S)-S-oxide reductase
MEDVVRMTANTNNAELLIALTMAAFYGKPGMITYLLGIGANPNGYPENNAGFHSHATPLHQAVASGSLETVKLLAEAGAKLNATDKIYNGTPLEWAMHMEADESADDRKQKFREIAGYLKER